MFMTVRSLYQDRHTIDAKTSVLNFRSAETYFTSGKFRYFTCYIFQFQDQCIKIRMLSTPDFHIRQTLFIQLQEMAQSLRFDRIFTLQNRLTGFIFQSVSKGSHGSRRSFNGSFQTENTFFILLFV